MIKFLFKLLPKHSEEDSEIILALLVTRLARSGYKGIKSYTDSIQFYDKTSRYDSYSTRRLLLELNRLTITDPIQKLKRLWVVRSYQCYSKTLTKFMTT